MSGCPFPGETPGRTVDVRLSAGSWLTFRDIRHSSNQLKLPDIAVIRQFTEWNSASA